MNLIKKILENIRKSIVFVNESIQGLINPFHKGIQEIAKMINRNVKALSNIIRQYALFIILFIIACFILGWATTKISQITLNSTLPGSFIVLTLLSKPFFESIIRLYNYSNNANKKLSKHITAALDVLKLFAVAAVLTMVFQQFWAEEEWWKSLGLFGLALLGLVTLIVTIFSYAGLMLLSERKFVSEEDYTEKDSQEAELIKSFRSLTEEQKSEIQQSINSKLDK